MEQCQSYKHIINLYKHHAHKHSFGPNKTNNLGLCQAAGQYIPLWDFDKDVYIVISYRGVKKDQ